MPGVHGNVDVTIELDGAVAGAAIDGQGQRAALVSEVGPAGSTPCQATSGGPPSAPPLKKVPRRRAGCRRRSIIRRTNRRKSAFRPANVQ